MPQLIHQFKQQASLTTGRALGLCLTQNTHFTGTAIDALIPVPSSRQTLRSRGFNPAKILADTIGHALGIPVMTNWVIKTG
ncbi:MAG: ComF family protein, partial [Pseudomonadales bacterium]